MSKPNEPELNINDLFQSAHDEGLLSPEALQSLTVHDLGAQIQAGLGTPVAQITSSEVVLVTLLIDDSGSIQCGNNEQIVRDGHNQVLAALMNSAQSHSILVHTCYLNGKVIFPYIPLAVIDEKERKRSGRLQFLRNPQAVDLNAKNYSPHLGTPLYDQTIVVLGRVLAKYQEFADAGVAARSVTLIVTDGADAHSVNATAKTVRHVVEDMVNERHIVAALGISDGSTDFHRVFREMGIRDEWILLPNNSGQDIRRAFQMFSQSALRASQGTAAFLQTAVGGFGLSNP